MQFNRQNRQKSAKQEKQPPVGSCLTVSVTPARLERATHSLEGCCSIQLSYGAETPSEEGLQR